MSGTAEVGDPTEKAAEPHHGAGRARPRTLFARLRGFRPRFRIASLIWALLVVAVFCAWQRDRSKLLAELETLRSPRQGSSWCTDQLLGAPNTAGAGDIPTAWAPASQDGQREWLVLEYPRAVRPTSVVVHETYNPGALVEVSAFDWWGTETVLWRGTDPTPAGSARGVSTIPVAANFNTRFIRLTLDSPAVPGWNEIDAVALCGADGSTQWASAAYASSAYGQNNSPPRWLSAK